MAIVQMRKIGICALKKERKSVLEQIQKSGVIEISESVIDEEGFTKMETSVARTGFERNATLAENALEILDLYAPEDKNMFASLSGKYRLTENEFEEMSERKEEIIGKANDIIRLAREISSVESEIVKLNGQLDAITPWLNMDVPGATEGTFRTSYFYGSIPESLTEEQVYQRIDNCGEFPKAAYVKIFYSDKNQTCIAAFCMKKDKDKFEETLRNIGFSKPSLIMRSVPAKSEKKWLLRLNEYCDRKKALENEIKDMEYLRNDIQIVADYFRSRAEKYDVLGMLHQSKHVFFITGYIPQNEEDRFVKLMTDKYTVSIQVEDIDENEEAPVLLKNNRFARPVESIVESFGLPKKGEIDPSAIMAFFYYLLFGLMLSDAAYGFIIFAVCFVALKKFPHMAESLNASLHMFLYCGISTMIWGVLFGGYFGDVVTIVSDTFFNRNIVIKPLWFAPLDDPMRLLLYSMAIGIVHMFLGLGIKGYLLLKESKIVDFICDVGLWYMFLIGLILLLLPTEIFASIAQAKIQFPEWLSLMAKSLTVIGAVGILLMSGRRSKKPFLRIALGAYDIYNVTSWLSDVLSYSRLLALGLATGVIASVINLMGTMLGDGIFGAILFIVVFILGHTLNIGINLLGAYVHTNRLQYVEFFGKFYEGGGRAFSPFKLKTKHVTVLSQNKLGKEN